MEVLSVNMHHEVWFLMEFLHVEIFDSETCTTKTMLILLNLSILYYILKINNMKDYFHPCLFNL